MQSAPRRILAALFLGLALGASAAEPDAVAVLPVPGGGLQPQALTDAAGTVHLLYFKADPVEGARRGDLFYVKRPAGAADFSAPIRINSRAGGAIAIGTVRGGQLALGRNGRVHAVWNGAGKPEALNYARLNEAGTAFEEQRSLLGATSILDGGCTVAADAAGRVYVVWQALPAGAAPGEDNRQVWVARSDDDGKTFAREAAARPSEPGVCPCCSMRAFAAGDGTLLIAYRAVGEGAHRDLRLLTSRDQGKTFAGRLLHPWQASACPMSTMALAEGPGGVVAAWETDGQVFFARAKAGAGDWGEPQAAPGTGRNRKHPALAVDARGEILLAWTEGTGWQKGGDLAWQRYDRDGRPQGAPGRLVRGIPAWGLPAAAVGKDGFVLIH